MITGIVRNGVVVLENGQVLPEGAVVRLEVITSEPEATGALTSALEDWAGKGVGLPADLAKNHDHYLHGLPKI
jgi:hypothetical protein